MQDRQQLRQRLRLARKSLTDAQQEVASENLLQMIINAKLLHGVRSCAAYLSNDGELNPQQLIQYCWQNKIQPTLPVLHPFTAGNLLFLNYRSDSVMCTNKYGIPEPLCEVQNVVPLRNIDVLFVPLVGFDDKGNRLGMGGGYYDRTLHCLAVQKAEQNRLTNIIGLAHDCQQVDRLPVQNWDVPLDAIITPTRIINCL